MRAVHVSMKLQNNNYLLLSPEPVTAYPTAGVGVGSTTGVLAVLLVAVAIGDDVGIVVRNMICYKPFSLINTTVTGKSERLICCKYFCCFKYQEILASYKHTISTYYKNNITEVL